jgi:vacuolar protein sorting-associated protein VTA1
LSEEAVQSRKYAKWKAAYIHNCLKNGETPHAGPLPVEGEDELQDVAAGGVNPPPSSGMGWNTNPYDSPQAPHQPSQPANNFQPNLPPYNFQPGGPPPQNFQPGAPQGNLPFILPDPPKDPEPKNPGGFIPYNPSTSDVAAFEPSQSSSALKPEQMAKALKYCKYIQSALTYEDVPTAISNLQKCLRLLQTGQDS